MNETQAEELLFKEINEPVAEQRHPVGFCFTAPDEWAEIDESATDESRG